MSYRRSSYRKVKKALAAVGERPLLRHESLRILHWANVPSLGRAKASRERTED